MPVEIERFIPDAATILAVLPIALIYGSCAAAFAAWLRARRGVRAPYTRKTFHFLILSAATAIQLVWGAPGVAVYGTVIVLMVLFAVFRGDGSPFYEALARPTDAPRRSLFIIVPLFTTAAGGVIANVLFPAWAFIGYMAVAWGDAIGEPVGVRWGRHPYRVPSIGGVRAVRTLEGSAAVFAGTSVACGAVLLAAGIGWSEMLGVTIAIGVVTAAVEALSHHGLDNLTIQIAASGVAAALL